MFRSLNAPATYLGVERRLCVLAGMIALIASQLIGYCWPDSPWWIAPAAFGGFWVIAYLITKKDPALAVILPGAIWQAVKRERVYDPFRF